MKKIIKVFNLTSIIKILVIFSVGFISRIIIYHCLDINVFSEYTNNISILYYFGLSTFSVYFDQLFSYQYSAPINVELTNNKLNFLIIIRSVLYYLLKILHLNYLYIIKLGVNFLDIA